MLKLLTALGIVLALIFLGFLGLMVYAYVTWPDETELERRRKGRRDRWVKDVIWMTQKLDISEEKDERREKDTD